MEGGELHGRVSSGSVTEKDAAHVLKQILEAVNHMHTSHEGKKTVTHRDLKLENVLLESRDITNFNVKIIDFGFA